MDNKTVIPYGLWPSPVTPQLASSRLRLDDVLWTPGGKTLVWSEGHSDGTLLAVQTGCDAPRMRSADRAPRGGVGYGGGAFTTGVDSSGKSFIIFADRDGRLYRTGMQHGLPQSITPPFGSLASPAVSPGGNWVVFVFSDGKTDMLGIVDTDGAHWPARLAQGADFYMQPAWHPSGEYLAWVEWNQPNMPWDGTRIQLARVVYSEGGLPQLHEVTTVAGGNIMGAAQPVFSPDGRWLCFLEEGGQTTDDDWPDLVLYDLASNQRHTLLACDGSELSLPAWAQGSRSIGWSPDSRSVYHFRYQGPLASLWKIDIESRDETHLDTGAYTWLTQLTVAEDDGKLAFIASAPNQPDQVVVWNNGVVTVSARSVDEYIAPTEFSMPREIRWLAPDGTPVYGMYYPPFNSAYTGPGLPPAILNIHGGPTSIASTRFNAETAYFTSRGYAWVDVNYRGSTGYGRRYRDALRGRWGEADHEDAAGCARALVDQGLADPAKLVIRGGSAGGYTVLNSLIHYPGLFRAAICLYGVSNLFTLDLETHKFEAHYNASLVGPLPDAEVRYREFSPIFHAHKIQDPIYIFQGDQDRVVPPSQSEEIVAILKQQKTPYEYKLYPGEGHGFRNTETVRDYLIEVERFLQQYVLRK